MSLTPVIPKARPDHPSLDYDVLRAEGIRHLENLATEIWTDFNAHDPGITLLEALSYAITDLGYRTRKLPIADLVAGGKEKAYFEPIEILPNAPVTARDYRKLLIDVVGVKNAWVEKYDAPELFTYKTEPYGIETAGKFFFREIATFDFESGKGAPVPAKIDEFILAYYGDNATLETIKQAQEWINQWVVNGVAADDSPCAGQELANWLDTCSRQEPCPWPPEQHPDPEDDCALLSALLCRYGYTPLRLIAIDDEADTDNFLRLNGLIKITLDLDDKIDPENESETQPIVERAMCRLQANRFLGHDYVQPPGIVGKLPVAICLHIEVAPGKNAVEAAAEALWQMEQHLTPTLRFYTFKEMLQKGLGVEEIYNGPLLRHGFLDDKEVDAAQLRTEIRHSDLTNAATAHPDVLTVHELKVKVYPDTKFDVKTTYPIYNPTPDEDDVIDPHNPTHLPRPLKPVIDLCASCVYVTQNGVRCEIKENVLKEALDLKRLLAECHDMPGGPDLPHGMLRDDLSDYRSVQYELPAVYGVGDHGITDKTPAAKRGARKQLQAYLAFFDQILAAYLLQLGEVRRLFSIQQDPTAPTYPFANFILPADPDKHPLIEVPGMTEIIDPNKPYSPESQATREDRRNRLLDHLLARFGEAFSEYVATLANACKNPSDATSEESYADFLQSKADFLFEIPDLGYSRGKGYDYTGGKGKDVWNTDNVAGVKKRVHRLLGLKGSWQAQSLLATPAYRLDIVAIRGRQGALQYQIVFKVLPQYLPKDAPLPHGETLLRSLRFNTPKLAQEKREELYSILWDADNYSPGEHPRENDRKAVLFAPAGKMELFSDPLDESDAQDLLEYIKTLVGFQLHQDKEGFHVLEHILLRPNDPDDHLLELQGMCCTTHDPYSSWLTVALPNWPPKFQDAAFRKHVEQTFRREMPAELAARFCWLDKEQMRAFEERLLDWMEAKASCNPDECHVTETANALIDWLNTTPCSCACTDCCEADQACDDCRECDDEQLKMNSYAG